MIKDLIEIATQLDSLGLSKEADELDLIIKKVAGNGFDETGRMPVGKWDSEEEEFANEDPARRLAQQIQNGKVALKDAIVDLVEAGLSIDHVKSLALDTLTEFED